MLLDYEKCREQLKGLLAGELDLPVEELWPVLYYVTSLIRSDSNSEDREYISNSMVLLEKLLQKADPDDNMDIVFEALDEVLNRYAPVDKVLDMLAAAGYSFTEPQYAHGNLTTLRDFLLEKRFSLELVSKMAQLGVDLNEPLVKGKTPACLLTSRPRMQSWGGGANEAEERIAKAVTEYFSVESLEALDANGTSAAHEAVRRNHYEAVEAMLKKGINVNLTQDKPSVAGTTLLHMACEHAYPQLVKMLMDAGADDTLKNEQEETPAHIAVSKKIGYKKVSDQERIEMIQALEHVDIPGKNGITPLMVIQDPQLYLSIALTPVLIEKGADVNRADNNGNTALMLHTFWYCYKDVIKAMVKAGYNINARNRNGDTVLHYVMKNKGSEMAVYLIKKGADVNIANEKQVTPAQIAVEKGMDEILPFLDL
ncbi:MAG: ankyrin repeat domain-containing protein [Acetatifactor sp.]|nr:ankyrin repeat domain-containing protein [Acetatifactor sp.]